MDYIFHLLILIGIYIILATSLNLMWGFAGLLSLGHAAFFGLGAYAAALLGMKLGLSFFLSTLIATAGVMLVGVIIAGLTLRLGEDYFILAVLAFQIVATAVLFNWVDMTRGPFGLYGIKRPVILNFPIATTRDFFILTAGVTLFLYFLIRRLVISPFGRVLKAIREDEVATLVLGKSVVTFKIMTFAVAAGFAAVAGSLLGPYFTALHPTSFTLGESILLVAMVILGGSGSLTGSVIGVVILLLIPEGLRFLELPGHIAGALQQIVYGLLLWGLMVYRPQGLIGEYKA